MMPILTPPARIPSVLARDLDTFPQPVRDTLQFIAEMPSGDDRATLIQFVAAFVHPDYVCNLSAFSMASEAVKETAHAFFEYFLTQGLSMAEMMRVSAWLTPLLSFSRMSGGRFNH